MANLQMKEWMETFTLMVANKFGLEQDAIMDLATETSEILEFNPLDFKPSLSIEVKREDDSKPTAKRTRTDASPLTSPPAPPPTPAPNTDSANTTATNSAPDTTTLRGEAAQMFINTKVAKGEWKFVEREVRRKGLQHSITGYPDGKGTYQFVIPGTDFKSLFNHKEVLKSAGYNHFSEFSHSGWQRVEIIDKGKTFKAFGKELSWSNGW